MTNLLTDTPAQGTPRRRRAEDIACGALHDVTTDARNFGILLPTAISDRAWSYAIAWPDPDKAIHWETGRTWTVLAHTARALLRARNLETTGLQLFNFTPAPALDGEGLLTLGVEVGRGDEGEPVITIIAAGDH